METWQQQGELWGRAPQGWAEVQEPMHTPLWRAMLDAARVGPGTSFFDAGCGSGGASVLAVARGARVSGLDAAGALIDIARGRVPGGDFRVGSLEALPFADGAFDAVFAANAVQYAGDRVRALRELRRVCTPDGRVVAGLFGPSAQVEFRAIFQAVRDALPDPPNGGGPFELSEPGTLEGLFSDAGLKVLGAGEADCPFCYRDFDMFWWANVAAGPFQGVAQTVGEEPLRSAVRRVVERFRVDGGAIRIAPNVFRFVVACP